MAGGGFKEMEEVDGDGEGGRGVGYVSVKED